MRFMLLEKEIKKKKKAWGWFVKPDAGNPEYNAAFFNSTFNSNSNNTINNSTVTTTTISGGMGESIENVVDTNDKKDYNIPNKLNEGVNIMEKFYFKATEKESNNSLYDFVEAIDIEEAKKLAENKYPSWDIEFVDDDGFNSEENYKSDLDAIFDKFNIGTINLEYDDLDAVIDSWNDKVDGKEINKWSYNILPEYEDIEEFLEKTNTSIENFNKDKFIDFLKEKYRSEAKEDALANWDYDDIDYYYNEE